MSKAMLLRRISLWLEAVRDGFVILLPLTFFGVAAVLLQHLPVPAYRAWMAGHFGPLWPEQVGIVVAASHGVFGLALAVVIAVQLSGSLSSHPRGGDRMPTVTVGVAALMNFMLVTLSLGPLSAASLGHAAMLPGMLTGLATAELLRAFGRVRWLSPALVPYDTETHFFHAMRSTLPVAVSGLVVVSLAWLLEAALPDIDRHVMRPVADWAQAQDAGAWWLSSLAAFINQAVWFVGVHGGHVLDMFASDLFAPPGTPPDRHLAFRPVLDSFVLLGGSGATAGLVLAILLGVRSGPQRRLAQFSVLPSLFNINETLIFGLPIALNPRFIVPFIGVPLVLMWMTLAGQHAGWLVLSTASVPWTTPPLISGWLLTGSWRGAAFQVLEIAVATAAYLPFVRHAESLRLRRQAQAFQEATQAILSDEPWLTPAIRRRDQVGMIARGLLSDLRAAMSRGGLQLAYQPKHDRAGRVVGVEALLRWPHPRHGELSPMVAVALCEQGGDIHRLGAWVLEQACACKARWNRHGPTGLVMAVNLSPTQLADADLPRHLAQCLAQHGLQAGEIELEITECQAIQNIPAVDHTLARLAALGVRLAMDDFGMGYSSLLYLRRFHVHAIKIDGSLTRDVLKDPTSADIIRSIAALGQAQRVDVVAEFVETTEQRQALERLGCDQFQGYLHSAALAEAACAAYVQQQRDAFRRDVAREAA